MNLSRSPAGWDAASPAAIGSASHLRVLHVIPSVSRTSGGPARAVMQMEQSLVARGVKIVTATTDDDGPDRRLDVPLARGVPTDGAQRFYFARQTRAYKVSLPLARWLHGTIRDFDLVHVHSLFSFAPVVAASIARAHGVPYVIRPLGVLNRYGMQHRRIALKAASMRLLEGGLLRQAAAVHFTSEQEQEEAAALGIAMRGEVIPLGIPPMPEAGAGAYHARFPGAEFPHLLFVSRIDPKKNIEGLLQAFRGIQDAYPSARLTICGDGDAAYMSGLAELAERLGVASRVVWAGHVEGELKASAFAAADVFVLPSYSENFGIAAVEALGAGLPCVLGEGVALAGEVEAGGAGLATRPHSDAIAAAIGCLLADDAARARAARAALALAHARYSPDAMADRLCALYARLARRAVPEGAA
ncbi:MAG: glycosyltransferase [Chloroflexota bacterium]|nr:glycosyltransferase [Chloroflexota bacterium]